MEVNIKYINDDDKCLGITGMAIAIVVWDAESLVSGISLDAPSDSSIEFMQEYYFQCSPSVSAKVAWDKVLERFRLSVGLLVSNVLCRRLVGSHSQSTREEVALLREMIGEEGRYLCSLEEDEIDAVFNKTYTYVNRIFSHSGVQEVARRFAGKLTSLRSMTIGDISEELAALRRL